MYEDVTADSRKVCGVKLTPKQVYQLEAEVQLARTKQFDGRNLFERVRDGIASRSNLFGKGQYVRGDVHLL